MISGAILEPLKKNLEGRGFGKVERTSFPGDSDHQVSGVPAYQARKEALQKRGWAEARCLRERRSGIPPGKLLFGLFPPLRNEGNGASLAACVYMYIESLIQCSVVVTLT